VIVQVMEDKEEVANNTQPARRVLASYTAPNPRHYWSSILTPNVNANNLESKPQLITLVQNNCSYGGSPLEDPNQHLSTFLRICDTVKSNGVHPDRCKLLMFPFSLRDEAAQWLEAFPQGSIISWEDLVSKFLAKFNLPQKSSKLEVEVQPFTQKKGVMEIERVNAIMAQNKQMHQKLQQQMELMVRKINDL